MKIGILTTEYHTESYKAGGIVRHVPKLVHWLADHGHDVVVYIPAWADHTFQERPGVWVKRFNVTWMTPGRWRNRRTPWLGFWEGSIAAVRRIRKDYKDGVIDVLHIFVNPFCYHTVRSRALPTVLRVTSSDQACFEINYGRVLPKQKAYLWFVNKAIRLANICYTSSNGIARAMKDQLGITIPVIRTPMYLLEQPDEQCSHDLPEAFILYCGGLVRVKGCHVLVDALAVLLKERPDIQVVFVGRDGPYSASKKMSEYLAEKLKPYESQYRLLGVLSHPELFSVMKKARFVAAPSLVDNLPNVLLESMFLGKVVLGTRGASYDEILEDGEDGFLIERDQVEQLKQGLVRAWDAPDDQLKSMGEKAGAKARSLFDPDRILPEILALYEKAITEQHV